MQTLRTLAISTFLLLTPLAFADEIKFSSAGKQSIVIELFTSQGCSSCPPSEEYINGFINNKALWSKYIPIVFHVDYWDYIGWKDVFAQPVYAARQYRYAKLKHLRTVYTPAFIVNGSAWRRGFFSAYPRLSGLNTGILNVVLDAGKIKAKFEVTQAIESGLNLNIAVLGMEMRVNISAGENEGRHATHNFVVLGYAKQLSEEMRWSMKLPEIKQVKSSRYAFVAWVSKQGDPSPLQAVGGWFENKR
ncbi:DUF1223 domain-containing protein [Beggiatoa alba]|nr:DUF1223 domain-containing protein [Beggiatoa alba]